MHRKHGILEQREDGNAAKREKRKSKEIKREEEEEEKESEKKRKKGENADIQRVVSAAVSEAVAEAFRLHEEGAAGAAGSGEAENANHSASVRFGRQGARGRNL